MTRAEDELYICGYSSSNKGAADDSWYKYCQEALKIKGTQAENEVYHYEVDGKILPAKKSAQDIRQDDLVVENWMYEDAPKENPLAKPYTPSKLDDADEADSVSPLADDGNYYKRGTAIHKLLQFLPQIQGDRIESSRKFLEQNGFSSAEIKGILSEVAAVLENPEFSDIFGENSRAEVPIMGEIDGKIISAQIDRLVILPNKIKIIDFKTNRRTDEIPPAYINQLKTYASLIKKIYPSATIETYILWTNKLKLSKI